MKNKQRRIDARLDQLTEMVHEYKTGNMKKLGDELESVHSFLREWSDNYGDEDEPRLAMITGMLADVVAIILLKMLKDADDEID